MTMTPQDRDLRQQASAEALPIGAHGDDPGADAYRYVYHAVRSAPLPEPPATFALTVARLARDHPESAMVETWLLRLLGATAALGTIVVAMVVVAPLLSSLPNQMGVLPTLPWPLLLAAGAGMVGAWLLDRAISHHTRRA